MIHVLYVVSHEILATHDLHSWTRHNNTWNGWNTGTACMRDSTWHLLDEVAWCARLTSVSKLCVSVCPTFSSCKAHALGVMVAGAEAHLSVYESDLQAGASHISKWVPLTQRRGVLILSLHSREEDAVSTFHYARLCLWNMQSPSDVSQKNQRRYYL